MFVVSGWCAKHWMSLSSSSSSVCVPLISLSQNLRSWYATRLGKRCGCAQHGHRFCHRNPTENSRRWSLTVLLRPDIVHLGIAVLGNVADVAVVAHETWLSGSRWWGAWRGSLQQAILKVCPPCTPRVSQEEYTHYYKENPQKSYKNHNIYLSLVNTCKKCSVFPEFTFYCKWWIVPEMLKVQEICVKHRVSWDHAIRNLFLRTETKHEISIFLCFSLVFTSTVCWLFKQHLPQKIWATCDFGSCPPWVPWNNKNFRNGPIAVRMLSRTAFATWKSY